jgi:hypothetical protein
MLSARRRCGVDYRTGGGGDLRALVFQRATRLVIWWSSAVQSIAHVAWKICFVCRLLARRQRNIDTGLDTLPWGITDMPPVFDCQGTQMLIARIPACQHDARTVWSIDRRQPFPAVAHGEDTHRWEVLSIVRSCYRGKFAG